MLLLRVSKVFTDAATSVGARSKKFGKIGLAKIMEKKLALSTCIFLLIFQSLVVLGQEEESDYIDLNDFVVQEGIVVSNVTIENATDISGIPTHFQGLRSTKP